MARYNGMVKAACVLLVAVCVTTAEAWEESTSSRHLMTALSPEESARLYADCALSLGTNPARFYNVKFQCCDVLDADSFDKFENVSLGIEPGFKELCGNACRCRLADDIQCVCGEEEVSESAVNLGISFSVILACIVLVCFFIDRSQTAAARKIDQRVHDAFAANESIHELTKVITDDGKPSL